ncbi:MAG TPA: hypothetical protein VFB79_22965 [Candidatus Angelobacter sp.]|nr:hypothetical protein [Candidatus Angelobacter sp.]
MKPGKEKFISIAVMVGFLIALAGCRAHVVKLNLINTSTQPVKTIIVDYPNATFGKDKLAPGETFSYTIKPLDTGMIHVQFTDATGTVHTYTGTTLHKGSRGEIEVNLNQSGVVVKPSVKD